MAAIDRGVYLLGHSRGAKVACLAAAADTRVAAVCLIDPVDNTVYAPLGPGFPSAADALRGVGRPLPVAVVGASLGGDCVPTGSNYERFFDAAPGVAWEVVIANAGHFQFLDSQTLLQQAICLQVRRMRASPCCARMHLLAQSQALPARVGPDAIRYVPSRSWRILIPPLYLCSACAGLCCGRRSAPRCASGGCGLGTLSHAR